MSLFSDQKPLREAIDFYKHKEGWANRLIAGDSLLIMNSLLEKEGMARKVQMMYIDPPYGIKYGSNFMPFVNKKDVKDNDEDLNTEPEMIKAFRDTWELGIHSYLTYIRDRLLLTRELLNESGSVFVQISDENLHHIKEILDEVFGPENFMSIISFRTKSVQGSKHLSSIGDFLIWYAKKKESVKYNQLFVGKDYGYGTAFTNIEDEHGNRRRMNEVELRGKINPRSRPFSCADLVSSGLTPSCVFPIKFDGVTYYPRSNRSWRTNQEGIKRLIEKKRLVSNGKTLSYVNYYDDFPISSLTNFWTDTGSEVDKTYVVQTSTKILERCVLMTSDPGDLVLDITSGSGTTGFVSEKYGRRWILCDTSRVALTLSKQRLMTSMFDYYQLAVDKEGISSGLKYKTAPHVTLKSITSNTPPHWKIYTNSQLLTVRRQG